VRLHGFINGNTGIYKITVGQKNLSFYNLYSIFDFIVEIGMKPFICYCFMLSDKASSKKTVPPSQANITSLKNLSNLFYLVKRFIGHLQVQ